MEINTIRYVFGSSKPELRRLLVKYGLPPAKNEQDLWRKTNYLVAKFKDEMLKDIAYIHPDRELILWSAKNEQNENDTQNDTQNDTKLEPKVGKTSRADGDEEKSNCCGCGCGSNKKSNVGGETNTEVVPQQVGGTAASLPQPQPQVVVQAAAASGSFQETLKNNMPLVVVGSLLLVGGLILFGNRQMS